MSFPSRSGWQIPAFLGRYRILRLLGEGGMSAVYGAEQDQPRRLVALKVIRAAWAGPELIRRFEQESQDIDRLHHPDIAQIYGPTARKRPSVCSPSPHVPGQPLVDSTEAQDLYPAG